MFTQQILTEIAIEFGGLIFLILIEEWFFNPKHS